MSIKMEILPKTMQEAIGIVYNVLNQGDSRYNNTEEEVFLSSSLVKKIVSLEEREIPKIQKPEERELKDIGKVQNKEKYVAKILLKQQRFQDNEIFFERAFLGLRPDIFVEKGNIKIIVECCSCSVGKILEYLSEAKEVWVITRGEFPWEVPLINEKMQLFIFKKGSNWSDILDFKEIRLNELKQTMSPLDNLI